MTMRASYVFNIIMRLGFSFVGECNWEILVHDVRWWSRHVSSVPCDRAGSLDAIMKSAPSSAFQPFVDRRKVALAADATYNMPCEEAGRRLSHLFLSRVSRLFAETEMDQQMFCTCVGGEKALSA